MSCGSAGSRPGRFHWGPAPFIVQRFSVSTGDKCFTLGAPGLNHSPRPAASHFVTARQPRVLLLVLDWRSIACALGSLSSFSFKRILRAVTSAAIGITTGLLLDSAQLVCLLELVAGSDNSANQPGLSAAYTICQLILQLVRLGARVM